MSRPPGRDPAASREEVVAHAAGRLARNEAFDVRAVATATGVGRTTLYRWFGDRTGLLSEALWHLTETVWLSARESVDGRGPGYAATVLERFLREVANAPLSAALLECEPRAAILALMSRDGHMQRSASSCMCDMLTEHTDLDAKSAAQIATVITPLSMSYVFAAALGNRSADVEAPVLILRRLVDPEWQVGR